MDRSRAYKCCTAPGAGSGLIVVLGGGMGVLHGWYSGCQMWLLVVSIGLKCSKILICSRHRVFCDLGACKSRMTRDVLELAAPKAIDVLLCVTLQAAKIRHRDCTASRWRFMTYPSERCCRPFFATFCRIWFWSWFIRYLGQRIIKFFAACVENTLIARVNIVCVLRFCQ